MVLAPHVPVLALFTFYRSFLIPTLFISCAGCYFIVQSGSAFSIPSVFWMKLFTNLFIGSFHWIFKPRTFYFYHNLGFSIRQLYGFAFLADFLVWLLLSTLTVILFL